MKTQTFLWKNGSWNKPLTKFKNSENTFLLIYGNNQQEIKKLITEFSNYNIAGCTTAGNILHGQYHEVSHDNSSITLTYFEFDKTIVKIHTESLSDYDDSHRAGQELYKKMNSIDKLSGAIVLTDGLMINGAQFAAGINKENEKKTPIIGGLSADDMQFTKTVIFTKDGEFSSQAVAIGFYGDNFKMFMESKSGIDAFGIERKVTKAVKNVLYELDKKPALDVYENFLGEKSTELPASGLHFPVEISENFAKKEGLVRTPIGIDRELKTITFTGEIPENEYLRLMTASKDSLAYAAEEVGKFCLSKIPKPIFDQKAYFNLQITCAARRAVLASDIDDELIPTYEATNESENNSGGFYAYGEFISLNNECCLANQTMSQCVFFEE